MNKQLYVISFMVEDEGAKNQCTGNDNGDDGGGDDGQDNDDEADDLDGEEDNNKDMKIDSKEGTSSKEKTPVSKFGQNIGYKTVSSNLPLKDFMDQERQLVLQMEGNMSKLLAAAGVLGESSHSSINTGCDFIPKA